MGIVKEKEKAEKEEKIRSSSRQVAQKEKARDFWEEVKKELQKVSWPDRPKVIKSTIIVVVVVFSFAFFVAAVDGILAQALVIIKGM